MMMLLLMSIVVAKVIKKYRQKRRCHENFTPHLPPCPEHGRIKTPKEPFLPELPRVGGGLDETGRGSSASRFDNSFFHTATVIKRAAGQTTNHACQWCKGRQGGEGGRNNCGRTCEGGREGGLTLITPGLNNRKKRWI